MKKTLAVCLFVILAATFLEAEKGSETTVQRTPEAILSAFLYAYPEKIGTVTRSANDWLIEVGNTVFSWAESRFLPEELPTGEPGYTAYPFYVYPPELPPIQQPTPEQKQILEKRIANRESNPPTRHPGIYNAIWRIEGQKSAWSQSKTAYFFGHELLIHRDLLDELASIEEELMARSGGDRELSAYIESLKQIEGFSWRQIADTSSLSYHSYGAAIDFLAESTGGKAVYWLWRKDFDPDWYTLAYERRHMPPKSFVEAFERRGFIWGGKWFYYDTIHFEYRPEILALNGWLLEERMNPVTGLRETIWVAPENR